MTSLYPFGNLFERLILVSRDTCLTKTGRYVTDKEEMDQGGWMTGQGTDRGPVSRCARDRTPGSNRGIEPSGSNTLGIEPSGSNQRARGEW